MNKHKSKASTAFSLIELSIVILIVGIIIAGITQSSRLVRQSKLKSAQNLTQSSPVAGMRSVALWFETTQDASFPAALDDEAQITQWNDINPQTSTKLYALPSSGTGHDNIKYDMEGINGLPSIKFAGNAATTGTLSLSTGTTLAEVPLTTTADPNNANAFTAFIVYKLDDTATTTPIYTLLYDGVSGTNGWGYYRKASDGYRAVPIATSTVAAGTQVLPTTQEIATITYSGYNSTNSQGTKVTNLYINSGTGFTVSKITDPSVAVVQPATRMVIGGLTTSTSVWKGLISEIIIFDTVLKTQDLKDVTNYLSKKYNIPLS